MILFLDFDGVLHPIANIGRDKFMHVPRLESVLRDFPDVQVVISSMWRSDGIDACRSHFSDDIAKRIIGGTPWTDTLAYAPDSEFILGVVRHTEIMMWIEQNAYIGPWVALDDSWREFPDPCHQLIKCRPEIGFGGIAELQLRDYLTYYLQEHAPDL